MSRDWTHDFVDRLQDWAGHGAGQLVGATQQDIEALQAATGVVLPADYLAWGKAMGSAQGQLRFASEGETVCIQDLARYYERLKIQAHDASERYDLDPSDPEKAPEDADLDLVQAFADFQHLQHGLLQFSNLSLQLRLSGDTSEVLLNGVTVAQSLRSYSYYVAFMSLRAPALQAKLLGAPDQFRTLAMWFAQKDFEIEDFSDERVLCAAEPKCHAVIKNPSSGPLVVELYAEDPQPLESWTTILVNELPLQLESIG